MTKPGVNIAFVHDALPFQGGAEKVLAAALEVFPHAPVYTLVYRKDAFRGTIFENHAIHTSFIDRLPGAHRHHRKYLPLMPFAIEQFDLRAYDVIVSFSYAVAHGVRTHPNQLHFNYIHTPMRYAWQNHPTRRGKNARSGVTRWALGLYMNSFRQWDFAAIARVDRFVAVSEWIAERVKSAYHRTAEVLYPPVDLRPFQAFHPRQDYYISVGRLVAHKKTDLIVQAFNRSGLPLVIVGEGPEMARLQRLAKPNVRLLGWQSQEQVAALLGRARAFIHAGEEDFGIAMVEAQAAGCPVIALNRGASREIVRAGRTGCFFAEQTVESLQAAVQEFERDHACFDPSEIRANAGRFDRSRFIQGFARLVEGGKNAI